MPDVREGPTPLGGDRSVAYWFDAAGREVEGRDLTLIVRGEIIECDGTTILGRTYVEVGAATGSDSVALSPPADYESGNAPEDGNDGPKFTWDIWAVRGGEWTHHTQTHEELVGAMGWQELPLVDQLRRVANMLGLPVWEAAPVALKKDVYKWLEDNRQEVLV